MYPIFPAFKSGNTNIFAFPATLLPGALLDATVGTNAASNCISPSTNKSGAFSFASLVASCTFSTSSDFALPYVENDNIATLGSFFTIALKLSAEDIAISDNSSLFGFGFNPQSANIKTPSSPYSLCGRTNILNVDTILVPGFVFNI